MANVNTNSTAALYLHVMEDVAKEMRPAFVDCKGGDSAFALLQAIWKLKIVQSGVKLEKFPSSAEGGAEVYQPPTMSLSPLFPAGHGESGTKPDTTSDIKPSSINGAKPFNDNIPQLEGPGDIVKEEPSEDYSTSYCDMGFGSYPKSPKCEPMDDDDEEPPLNEDDDDEEDMDYLSQGGEYCKKNLVLAQFEKVYKTRGNKKWKCILKYGILHLNDKDITFKEAMGEFDF